MCKITTIVGCPHCHSAKGVKNGEKNTGVQNFLCRGCGRQFQYVYKYKGAGPGIKHLILSILTRNCGIRDIGAILRVSRNSVLNVLHRAAGKCALVPKLSRYRSVQVDEFWSYVYPGTGVLSGGRPAFQRRAGTMRPPSRLWSNSAIMPIIHFEPQPIFLCL